jgi:hypothetical protein
MHAQLELKALGTIQKKVALQRYLLIFVDIVVTGVQFLPQVWAAVHVKTMERLA